MALDPNIILSGRSVDVAGAMSAGNALAAQTNQLQQQNALSELYRTQGAGIVSGDQGAMNALAALDPAQAMGFEQGRLGMDQTRQQMGALDEQTKRATAEYARGLSAEQAAASAAELEAGVKRALTAPTPEAFDALMVEMGQPDMVGMFEDRAQLAGQYMSIAEILRMNAPPPAPDPTASQNDYNFYSQQEAAAGRTPLSFNEWDTQGKKAGAATNTVTFGTSADGAPKVGPSLAEMQTSVKTTTDLIDEIANDPALAGVTGSLQGGGGNAVDEFSMGRRAYYGDKGLAVIQKVAQLQNTAWLAARDMLKGGGAITDYESKKAEGAMARLSRAQGDAEFKAALKDLKDAITEGSRKLQEATGAAGSGSPGASGLMSDDDLNAIMSAP